MCKDSDLNIEVGAQYTSAIYSSKCLFFRAQTKPNQTTKRTFPTPMARSMFTTNTILNIRSSSPSSWGVGEHRRRHWDLALDALHEVLRTMVYLWGLRLAYGHLILQLVEVVYGRLLGRHVPSVQQCLRGFKRKGRDNGSDKKDMSKIQHTNAILQ